MAIYQHIFDTMHNHSVLLQNCYFSPKKSSYDQNHRHVIASHNKVELRICDFSQILNYSVVKIVKFRINMLQIY